MFEFFLKKFSIDTFFALKDISISIESGECVGIIGKNGSGKSTLLKLIANITKPTSGKIKTKGKIAGLIELGAGFHLELTGKENIFLYGAILGMTRKEIKEKFNSIVEFSELGEWLETPVKFYSSGMFVRLSFAIIIHSNPDILLIDEAIVVGDEDFQKKCFKKIEEFKKSKKIIIFVSHDTDLVCKHTERVIYLEKGRIIADGKPKEVINIYKNKITKLGVSYNVFDDSIELLPFSIKAIRKNVDYISIVYQNVSNMGEKAEENIEEKLKILLEKKLVDEIYIFTPDLTKTPQENEIKKRNIGLELSRKNEQTYHLSMDCDEFYLSKDIKYAIEKIKDNNYDTSYCLMQTFYKNPTTKIIPPEKYAVTFFFKIRNNINFELNKISPCIVDPTRSIAPENFIIFERNEIEMYHMSYVRNNLAKKLRNSSARINFQTKEKVILDHFQNWKKGDKALLAGLEDRYLNTTEVDNFFDINIEN